MPRPALLLLVLTLAACGDREVPDADSQAPTADGARTTRDSFRALRPDSLPAERRAEMASRATMPYERSAMVFDTMEPPPVRVEIQPRPEPAPPAPRPAPRPPLPRPDPAPAPRPPAPAPASGSCDVRQTEGFCFAYTGAGWSRQTATEHCGDAPEASYRPATCPAADAIATCRFTRDGAPALEIVYTYYAPYDPTLARLACPGDFERIETGG